MLRNSKNQPILVNMRGVFLCVALAGGLAFAQTELQTYVNLRKQHGVSQAVGLETLQSFVGKRTLEVSGTLKGHIREGDGTSGTLMLETLDRTSIYIRSGRILPWMLTPGSQARLLIRAERAHENAGLEAELIGAAREEEMRAWEEKNRPRPAPIRTPRTTASRTPSRSSGQPRRMPGEIREVASASATQNARTWNLAASDALPYYVDFIRKYNRRLTQTQATRIAEGVIGFSLQFGVDARLVMALLMAESSFNPNTTSHAGAMGLGQLMPGTARELGVSNAYDTNENLYGTVKLLSRHISTYTAKTGDDFEGLRLALAAYNAGPGAVRRHRGIPPYRETQNYVRKVIAFYRQLTGEG